MLVGVFGPKSFVSDLVVGALSEFLLKYGGETLFVHANDVGSLRSALASRTTSNVLIYCCAPSKEMLSLLRRAKVAGLLAFDDTYDSIWYMMSMEQFQLPGAIRHYMRALSLVQPTVSNEAVTLIRRNNLVQLLRRWLEKFANLNGIASDEELARWLNDLEQRLMPPVLPTPLMAGDSIAGVESAPQLLSESDKFIIDLALKGYASLLKGKKIANIDWDRRFFSSHDLPDGTDKIRLDIAGKARHLVFGPYFYLPMGKWRAKIRFSVEKILSGCDLLVDVFSGVVIFEGEIASLDESGAFSLDIDFAVTDSSLPIEIRIYMRHGSIEGAFSFGNVTLCRVDEFDDSASLAE